MTERKTGGRSKAKAAADPNTAKWVGIGAGAALGSAAIAAAVLYVARARQPKEAPKLSALAADAQD